METYDIPTTSHEERLETADMLLMLLEDAGQDTVLKAASPIQWLVAMDLADAFDQTKRTLGLALMLELVIQHPASLVAAIKELHRQLAATSPQLRIVGPPA